MGMFFLLRGRSFSPSSKSSRSYLYIQASTFVEARVKWVRDRGLDHAVEKEKNLKAVIALKNFLKSEPTHSMSVSVAAEKKEQLGLPIRAIEFIRKYPLLFEEFRGGGDVRRPYVRLTPEALEIDEEERMAFAEDRSNSADRLLKLLMLTKSKRLPLRVVDKLKWDLGLPDDYVRSLLPDYPDYFQIASMNPGSNALALELVCWNKDLAISVMEKNAMNNGGQYKKGTPLAFPLQYSRGYDLEKKVKKWLNEWQKLPYISPYEDATHLAPKSDLAEKWIVGVLHELFHLFVSKKTEKDNALFLGEYLGLRASFRRAFIDYPGIFYVSNKIRTHTVVLREAFKRDLLVQKHPLMGLRYHYIHLMHKEKDSKGKEASKEVKTVTKPKIEDDGDKGEEDEEEETNSSSFSETEEASDTDGSYNKDESQEEDEEHSTKGRILPNRGTSKNARMCRSISQRSRGSIQLSGESGRRKYDSDSLERRRTPSLMRG